jgi:nicotinamidase-related amidase
MQSAAVGVVSLALVVVYLRRRLTTFRHSEWTADPATTAVIVLDPLEVYRTTFSSKSIDAMVRFVADAKTQGVPVIVTRWVRTRGSVRDTFDDIGHWSEFVPTATEPFLAEVAHHDWDLRVDTIYADAFAPTYRDGKRVENELRDLLDARGIDTVVCVGTWAEACVARTAYSIAVQGRTPVLLRPAIGGHWVLPSLVKMDRLYAHVVQTVRLASG